MWPGVAYHDTNMTSTATERIISPQAPVCGFFAPEGVEWEGGLAEAFAKHVHVRGQPLCFRVHDWKRDWPEACKAALFAEAHGMVPYLSITAGGEIPASVDMVELGKWSHSYGNGNDWAYALTHAGTHVQDDSGPVGAMYIMRNRVLNGKPVLFHAYGQTGFHPQKMLPTMKALAGQIGSELIWSECHWGFPGKDKNMGDRPDVTSAEGGAYVREAVWEANQNGVKAAVYTPKFFFTRDHQMNAAGLAFFGYIAARPLRVPITRSWKMLWELKSV